LSEKFWSFVQEAIDLLAEKRSLHTLLPRVKEREVPATTVVVGGRPPGERERGRHQISRRRKQGVI